MHAHTHTYTHRFFFLSNDELIEILAEAKNPLNVQPFAKKIFEAVSEFKFNEDQVGDGTRTQNVKCAPCQGGC